MQLPLIDLFTSCYKDGDRSRNHTTPFKLGVQETPFGKVPGSVGFTPPPKPNCNHQRSKHDTDLRSVSRGKSIVEPLLEAHMWSIWNCFLFPLWKVQGTHPEVHCDLITVQTCKMKWNSIILSMICPNHPVCPLTPFHIIQSNQKSEREQDRESISHRVQISQEMCKLFTVLG